MNSDLHARVKEWALRMGYQGQFPDSMKGVINPSTFTYWEQVIQKVKPKDEIKLIRDNILIHTLKGTFKNTIYTQKCKELEKWKERKKTETLIKDSKDKNKTITDEIERMKEENKILYEDNKNKSKIIKESKQKTYLYEKKAVEIEKEIEKLEKILKNIARHDQIEVDVKVEFKDCTTKLSELRNNNKYSEFHFQLLHSENELKEKCSNFIYSNRFQDEIIPSITKIKDDLNCCVERKNDYFFNVNSNKQIKETIDLSALHMIHIEAELLLRLENAKIRKLRKAIDAKMAFIKRNITDKNRKLQVMEYINFNMENFGYKEIQSLKSSLSELQSRFKSNNNTLQDANIKLAASNASMVKIKSKILDNLKEVETAHIKLFNISDEVLDLHDTTIKQTNNILTFNPDLLNILISDEVIKYSSFCFDFNRKLFYTQKSNYLRDMKIFYQPVDENLSKQKLKEMSILLTRTSGKSAVFTICDFAKQKHLIDVDRNKEPEVVWYKKKEIPDINEQEVFTRDMATYLKSVLNTSHEEIQSTVSLSNIIYKFFREIPINDIIINHKLFDWEEFQKYINEFDKFYEI